MSSFTKATKDASFLELNATVVAIVKQRLPFKMKERLSSATNKAEAKGEKINTDFLIKFLKDWFSDLSRDFGISKLIENKNASSLSSSPSPSSFKTGKMRSGPTTVKAVPCSQANVTAVVAQGIPSANRVQQQQPQPQQQQQSSAWEPTSLQFNRQSIQLSEVCIYCSDAHLLDGCPRFSQLSCVN